jgi:hypothetical protein
MSAAEIRAELRGIELAWWPDFLLAMDTTPPDEESFTVSLENLALCLREEDSLA